MFHSYRRFNQSSKKGFFYLLLVLILLVIWGITAYKGVKITPKVVTKNINVSD